MNPTSRRWIARGVQLLLLAATAGGFVWWVSARTTHAGNVRLTTRIVPPEPSEPGDLRIYTADSALDLILVGDRVLAGLSPTTVAKVRQRLDTAGANASGVGGSVARAVTQTVAGAI